MSTEQDGNQGQASGLKKAALAVWNWLRPNPYIWVIFYVPVVLQTILIPFGFFGGFTILFIVSAGIAGAMGYFRASGMEIKDGYFKTYFALFLPLFIAALGLDILWIAAILDKTFASIFILITSVHFVFSALFIGVVLGPPYYLVYLLIVYGSFTFAFAVGMFRKKQRIANRRPIYLSVLALTFLMALAVSLYTYRHPKALLNALTKDAYDLPPIAYESRKSDFVNLRGDPTFYIERDFPVITGSMPLDRAYRSAAKALYKKPSNLSVNQFAYVYFPTQYNPYIYEKLIKKEFDMIFAFAPLEEELQMARKRNVELAMIPIGKEAFVFLVNEKNSVQSLTISQLQKIYTGEIENWREVGGGNERVLTFQQYAKSESQKIMELIIMEDLPFASPPRIAHNYNDRGYRNAENAIGYSLKFFAEDLRQKGVRLLAIDGIEPTFENIQNGTYPFINEFYIVTRKNDVAPNVQKLIDWFLSDQGQALIEDVGYVPIRSVK
ncbi:MAG: substrate-binding domain-containing protein [Helicobacteraceae bacterium]|nr:substrate-binding domain-containing protein [Helicobacteraceae bacterium]